MRVLALVLGAFLPCTAAVGGQIPEKAELQLVYFGSHHCGFCEKEEMKAALREARAIFRQKAAASGWKFSTWCVALDEDRAEGEAFLDRHCGDFDVLVNTGEKYATYEYQEYVVRSRPADGLAGPVFGTPWLAVVKVMGDGPQPLHRVPGRLIPRWIAQGAPLEP